ncbi:D-alanyl-D-alanine carboxypeptidase [Streptomyces sp. NPDC101160]|uniref:D-alanyl-D-alanine carboxypeptidase n=1 Tax=Streptomyces sp. NPDC101160 TaxID=3366118 RepID=UPI0037F4600B
MAGESPDKAEQGEGRDPRLSVVQDRDRDRVDQPTAVFKALTPRTAPEDEPGEPEAAEEPVEPAGEASAKAEDEAGESSAPTGGEDESEVAPEDEAEAREKSGPEAEAPAASESWFAVRKPVAGEPESGSEPEAKREPEPKPESNPEPKAEEKAEPKADEKPKPGSTDDAEDKAKPESKPERQPESKAESEPEREAESKAESKPEREAESTSQPAPEPKAEPKSQPAPEPKPQPVDQPTAVFKAVKPPVVDQPTTALKLPPRSTFRPLQGDITQEQAKPANASASPTASASAPTATPAPASKAEPQAAPRFAQAAPVPVPPSLTEPERTKQQPLPPRPPLEILAELTNTPPPPETTLRTTVRRVKIWTPLVLLLLVVFAVVQIVRPLPDPKLVLSAAPQFSFEGGEPNIPWPSEGQGAAEVEGVGSLGTYGAQQPAPIASMAKTMTAYVILRDHPIKGNEEGPQIEVDKTAGEQAKAKDESTAPIKEGQRYSEKELLELLMIPSGNNVARLLGRWDAGSEEAFVAKMNAAAKELGMTGSTYTDPSGLQSTTMSTPLDQLKLAKAVMQFDVFREVVDMPNVTVDGIPTRIENNNTILLEPGVAGIKTGSSTPAGGNLLWAAYTVVDGEKRRIVGVTMGAKDAAQLYQKLDLAIAYSLKVIQKAQKVVTSATVVKKGQVVGYVDDGLGGRTPVVATKDVKAIGWPGLKVSLTLGPGGKAVPHKGKAGDVVGEVSIGTGTGKVSAPVALEKDLAEPGYDKKLTRLG